MYALIMLRHIQALVRLLGMGDRIGGTAVFENPPHFQQVEKRHADAAAQSILIQDIFQGLRDLLYGALHEYGDKPAIVIKTPRFQACR